MIIQVEKTKCYLLSSQRHPPLSPLSQLSSSQSVEIRWPMLTSYIICIFFRISSPHDNISFSLCPSDEQPSLCRPLPPATPCHGSSSPSPSSPSYFILIVYSIVVLSAMNDFQGELCSRWHTFWSQPPHQFHTGRTWRDWRETGLEICRANGAEMYPLMERSYSTHLISVFVLLTIHLNHHTVQWVSVQVLNYYKRPRLVVPLANRMCFYFFPLLIIHRVSCYGFYACGQRGTHKSRPSFRIS